MLHDAAVKLLCAWKPPCGRTHDFVEQIQAQDAWYLAISVEHYSPAVLRESCIVNIWLCDHKKMVDSPARAVPKLIRKSGKSSIGVISY